MAPALLSRDALLAPSFVGEKRYFIGLDLAPLDYFESGLIILNDQLEIVTFEKHHNDDSILHSLRTFPHAAQAVLVVDPARPIQGVNRWRNELMKFRATQPRHFPPEGEPPLLAARVLPLVAAIQHDTSLQPLFTNNLQTKLAYKLDLPFKARTVAGCRLYQAWLSQKLFIRGLPDKKPFMHALLEAVLAAYTGYTLVKGQEHEDFEIVEGRYPYPQLIAKNPVYWRRPTLRRRLFRYRRKF